MAGVATRSVTPSRHPSRADAVVVGGGCIGASVAFHLTRRGLSVVLLEKGHVASGATGHSGALVRQPYESLVGIRLARRSLEFFQRFERETGFLCDFRNTGFLSGARTKDLEAFEALFKLLAGEGVKVERLSAREAMDLEPGLDASDYAAVVHDPDAGYADPIATAAGFAAAATRGGATILEDTAAQGIVVQGDAVAGVRVRGGHRIASERIVLAAGNWTPGLARPLGVRLPIGFIRGDVAILRRPVGFRNTPRIHFDFYNGTYSRPEGDKDMLVGYMRTDPRKTVRRHELTDDSIRTSTVRGLRTRLSKRFPAMARAQPRGGWAGVYDVTPDRYPVVDRVGPRGLYVAAGLSGHGFKLSPELGRLVAAYVTEARRPADLETFRASRFRDGEPIVPDAPFPARHGPRLP